jgi:hypothetical protein
MRDIVSRGTSDIILDKNKLIERLEAEVRRLKDDGE